MRSAAGGPPLVALGLVLLAACGEESAALDSVLRDPGALRGSDMASVEALFGAPAFQRREGEARVWRYAAEPCWLDLFFYPGDSPEAPLAVAHFEIRNRGDAAASSRTCLAAIAANKAALE